MKRFLKPIVFGALIVLAFTSCGQDGENGDAFGALSWSYTPSYAYFEDPSVPSTVYNGEYYPLIVGQWDYEYISSGNPGYLYYGYYTTYEREGESGGLFSDGDDGEDIYFDMYLGAYGPSFYEDGVLVAYSERSLKEKAAANSALAAQLAQEAALVEASGVKAATGDAAVLKASVPKFSRTDDDKTWEIVQTVTSGKYTITLKANKVKLP